MRSGPSGDFQIEVEEQEGQAFRIQVVKVLNGFSADASSLLGRGDPVTEFIRQIKMNSVDLVAASSRGISTVNGKWLGSVSAKLVLIVVVWC